MNLHRPDEKTDKQRVRIICRGNTVVSAMTPLEVFERYNKAIQSIYGSRLMVQILLSVEPGGTPLSTLRDITGSTSQALIPKIRKLENLALVEASGLGYGPTTLGSLIAQKIGDFSLTMGTLTAHLKFWEDHDLSTVPWPLLERIGDLLNAEIIYDTGTDILHVYTHYLQLISEAKEIIGISAAMSPGLAEALGGRIVEGIPVDLMVNAGVLGLLDKEPYRSQINALAAYDNFRVWVTDRPIGFGMTVTDSAVSLGFYKRGSEIYDSSTDLFSRDPSAVAWGRQLFEHLRASSVPIQDL
jgi:predicted transcriptional regulator